MSARPVIGIVCCSRAAGDELAQTVLNRYVEAATRHADCAALLVPARPDLMAVAEIADRIDGVLLTGSPSNIAPGRYGGTEPGSAPFDPGRDETSLMLIGAMIERSRPVLGICRGFQEINVAFGGTLRQDLGAPERSLSHHAPQGAGIDEMFGYGHEVALTDGGILSGALHVDRLTVNSVHYQGIDKLGRGLQVEATAPDNVVEAVSARPNGAPVLAVQWHPEWQTDRNAASRRIFGIFAAMLRDGPVAPDGSG